MPDLPAPPRTPWRNDFPSILAHADPRVMQKHPLYRDAKDGVSTAAAVKLIYELISNDVIAKLNSVIAGREVIFVGVHAEEATGRNKSPLAYAMVLAKKLGQGIDKGIVQSSIANHGQAPSIYHRLASQPWFGGEVIPGQRYFLVDDTCTAGGTLANLKGFIETNGGEVVGMSVLARSGFPVPYEISLDPVLLRRLRYKLRSLEAFWSEEFGYGLECLTQGEAGHLHAAASTDAIRNRLAEARPLFGCG